MLQRRVPLQLQIMRDPLVEGYDGAFKHLVGAWLGQVPGLHDEFGALASASKPGMALAEREGDGRQLSDRP